jgi:hypothetical protein
MRRLVESWICAERDYFGNSLAAAIRKMNETHGTRLTHSRVAEWRRGVYAPSQVMLSHMLYRTLVWALKKADIKISDPQFRELEKFFWVTGEKDGRKWVELQ